MAKVMVFTLCVACGLGACSLGCEPMVLQPVTEVPVIVEVIKEVEVPVEVLVEVPVEVPVEVIKEVIVEKVVEVPVALTDWEDVDELMAFLEDDDTDRHVILQANSEGIASFIGPCEDLALQLRDRAMAQGKYLSIISLHPVEYIKWQSSVDSWRGEPEPEENHYHAICMAKVGDNEFWYIEPATDEAWLALYQDDRD